MARACARWPAREIAVDYLGAHSSAGLAKRTLTRRGAATGYRPTCGRRGRASDRYYSACRHNAAAPLRHCPRQPTAACRTSDTASASTTAQPSDSPADYSVSPSVTGCNSVAESCPPPPRLLTSSRATIEIRLSVMLRGVASWKSFMDGSRSGRGSWRRRRIRSPNGACSTWPSNTISRVADRATHELRRRVQCRRRCFSRAPERPEASVLPVARVRRRITSGSAMEGASRRASGLQPSRLPRQFRPASAVRAWRPRPHFNDRRLGLGFPVKRQDGISGRSRRSSRPPA